MFASKAECYQVVHSGRLLPIDDKNTLVCLRCGIQNEKKTIADPKSRLPSEAELHLGPDQCLSKCSRPEALGFPTLRPKGHRGVSVMKRFFVTEVGAK